jgi:hypothetical protein
MANFAYPSTMLRDSIPQVLQLVADGSVLPMPSWKAFLSRCSVSFDHVLRCSRQPFRTNDIRAMSNHFIERTWLWCPSKQSIEITHARVRTEARPHGSADYACKVFGAWSDTLCSKR